MKKSEYHINMTYEEFAPMFKAEKFVPEQWADLFVASGAKFVTFLNNLIYDTYHVPGANPPISHSFIIIMYDGY